MRLRLLMFCLLVPLLVPAMANTQAEKHPGMREFAAELAGGDEAQMQAYLAVLEQADYKDSIIKAMTRPAESKPWHKYRPIFLTDDFMGRVAQKKPDQVIREMVRDLHRDRNPDETDEILRWYYLFMDFERDFPRLLMMQGNIDQNN